jgi:hypothetical protein
MVNNSTMMMSNVIKQDSSQIEFKLQNTTTARRTLFNNLVSQLENSLSDRKEVLKINRIVENAIHWALVNGKLKS